VTASTDEADSLQLSATGELEPIIKAAIDSAFANIIDWSEHQAALERVKAAKLRLARQGDPAGIMSGDRITRRRRTERSATSSRSSRPLRGVHRKRGTSRALMAR
jgi:hypothetical protein